MTGRDFIFLALGFGSCVLVIVVSSIFSKKVKHYLEGK